MFLYIKEGRSFGPVSGADLLELLESGILAPEDLARPRGEREWMRVSEVARGVMSGRFPSELPPASTGGSIPVGSRTVFTSAPPIPPAPKAVSFPLAGQTSCAQCATPASPDASFCKRCGAALGRPRCAACGRSNDADASFCEGCGRRVGVD